MNKPVIWDLIQQIFLVRTIESIVRPMGYHTGLTGSCVFRGYSDKDCDIILYPRKTQALIEPDKLLEALKSIGLEVIKPLDHHAYGDDKIVYGCKFKNRRVDVFFLK